MYKLLSNPRYIVDHDYNIHDTKINKKINNDEKISLLLYNKIVTKTPKWFYLMAKYKIELPYELYDRVDEIEFNKFGKVFSELYEYNISTKTPLIITVGDTKYAVPLILPTIAISNTCEIIDIHTRQKIKNVKIPYSHAYKKIYIHGKHIALHRLMINAWVYNPNTTELLICNHKDGNKQNNILTNLEWCTFSRNIKHAVDSGLRNDNLKVKIRHYKTFEIKEFNSIRDMCAFIGKTKMLSPDIYNLHTGRLINDWEIRMEDDKRDWYFKTGREKRIPIFANKIYDVYKHGKHINREFNLSMLANIFNFINKRMSEDVILKLFKFHNYELKITKLYNSGPYDVLDVKNDKVLFFKTIKEVIDYTGVNRSVIYKAINRPETFVYYNYAFRIHTDKPWNKNLNYRNANKPKSIIVYNNNNDVVFKCKSLRECSRKLNITTKTILKYIRSKSLFNNKYLFKYI